MTEFIVGLVAILVLLTCLVQITMMTKIHTDAMFDARHEAGTRSMYASQHISEDTPLFIYNWNENGDGKRYTKDDTPTDGPSDRFTKDIVEYAAGTAEGWDILNKAEYKAIPNLRNNIDIGRQFGLVEGKANAPVMLLPAFQRLIYNKPEIDVECTVWMTWTKGIY